MVFVFSSQCILKPLDINCQDISVNRDTVVLRSSRTGSGGGLAMFGGRPAGPKTVVFCVLPQLEAITVSSGRSQMFLLHAAEKTDMGEKDTSLSSVPLNCSTVQSPIEVAQRADTPVNQYSSYTGKNGSFLVRSLRD